MHYQKQLDPYANALSSLLSSRHVALKSGKQFRNFGVIIVFVPRDELITPEQTYPYRDNFSWLTNLEPRISTLSPRLRGSV